MLLLTFIQLNVLNVLNLDLVDPKTMERLPTGSKAWPTFQLYVRPGETRRKATTEDKALLWLTLDESIQKDWQLQVVWPLWAGLLITVNTPASQPTLDPSYIHRFLVLPQSKYDDQGLER